jgi:hypothetical protein
VSIYVQLGMSIVIKKFVVSIDVELFMLIDLIDFLFDMVAHMACSF